MPHITQRMVLLSLASATSSLGCARSNGLDSPHTSDVCRRGAALWSGSKLLLPPHFQSAVSMAGACALGFRSPGGINALPPARISPQPALVRPAAFLYHNRQSTAMLFRSLPLLLAFLALCSLVVEARPMKGPAHARDLSVEERGFSNAERLKRGLPLNPPVFRRVTPGREDDPTPRTPHKPADRPSSVPVPSHTYSGRVAIRQTNGTHIGFLNNSDSGIPNVDTVGALRTDLEVKITGRGDGPFDLLATNPAWAGSPFIGGGTNGTLSPDSQAVVPLMNTTQTTAGKPPTPTGASAIWDFDAHSSLLTPHWTNLNGSHIAPIILWHREANLLLLTGDESDIDGKSNLAVEFFLVK